MDVASTESESEESSLDPADWIQFRELAHRALDDAINFVEGIRDRPVWQPVPNNVREALSSELPREGRPLEVVYEEFKTSILPYSSGNVHPRFFGWVQGSGLCGNLVAEVLSAAMNSNCGGRDHGAIYVEREVIKWCKELFGFPEEAAGLVVSGTSMATLIALGVARNAHDDSVRSGGIGSLHEKLVAYASEEVHQSAVKSMEVLGLGSASLHKIPVDADFAIDAVKLKERIGEDRALGYQPFCVIGCAGTVNTGAIDDLGRLASICAEEGLWFHVDGAFGALCMMSGQLRGRLSGIERADSLAFDFHKWAHVQYEAGCVLIRSGDLYRRSYNSHVAYLHQIGRGLGAGCDWPCDLGIELSRGFRALKVWFALKEHGTDKFGTLIDQNCAQAQYLNRRIETEPYLELLAPTTLNIVCFRYRKPGLTDDYLDDLNENLVADIQEMGLAAPSTTRIRGRLAIRVNITNHRTRKSDISALIDAVLSVGHDRCSVDVSGPCESRTGI